jgi:hypothetical protein
MNNPIAVAAVKAAIIANIFYVLLKAAVEYRW